MFNPVPQETSENELIQEVYRPSGQLETNPNFTGVPDSEPINYDPLTAKPIEPPPIPEERPADFK